MADVFLARRSDALRVVDRSTLPLDLSGLAHRTERESGRQLTVFELDNRFGIPAFCTVLDSAAPPLMVHGSGASLSRHHALSRSLYEVAQVFVIKSEAEWNKNLDTQILQRLQAHSFHSRCAELDLPDACRRQGYVVVSYRDTAAMEYPALIEEYLSCLSETLDSNGATAFASDLMTFENGIHVSHSFFVGQDYLFLAGYGNVVFPQAASVAAARDHVNARHQGV